MCPSAGGQPAPNTLFRLAIAEVEACYLGDRQALQQAYPRARSGVLARYFQDGACATRELLADAVHAGGSAAIRNADWLRPGQGKHEWAEKISPLLDPERNLSASLGKLREGVRRLVAQAV